MSCRNMKYFYFLYSVNGINIPQDYGRINDFVLLNFQIN